MFKFVIAFAACLAYASAGILHSTALAAAPAAIGYANAPLYAAGGSSQVDVRHNYDGSLSSYTTAPFGYAGPYSSRYVAGAPAPYAATPAAFAAPATSFAAAAASPYVASYGSPYTAQYSSPYAAPFASPYTSHYSSPYTNYANAAGFAAPLATPRQFFV